MDGFHALGTQGRSHPRKRQDLLEEKLPKSWPDSSFTANLGVSRQRLGHLILFRAKLRVLSRAEHHSSQPFTLATTSLPSFGAT